VSVAGVSRNRGAPASAESITNDLNLQELYGVYLYRFQNRRIRPEREILARVRCAFVGVVGRCAADDVAEFGGECGEGVGGERVGLGVAALVE
jgi:hypothetical protein